MRLTRSSILAGLVLVPAVICAEDVPGTLVSEVVIEGAKVYHPERVKAQLKLRDGDPFDPQALADDVKTLHAIQAFIDIRSQVIPDADGSTVKVVYQVKELPYISEVSFTGVNFFDGQGLDKVARLKRGSYLHPLTLERDRRALEQHFRDKQFLYATVEALTVVDPRTEMVSVEFAINLGEPVKVARVVLDGLPPGVVRLFTIQRLNNKPGASFREDMMQWDAGAIGEYLRSLGYLDAKVVRFRHEFFDAIEAHETRFRHGPRLAPEGERNDSVVATFFIEPGEMYQLGDVKFIGNTVATEEELREEFGLPRGAEFRRRDINAGKARSMRIIRNLGYARAEAREDRVVDTENRIVNLVLHITEGEIYQIGRVDPAGNVVTKDQVIRRAVELKPGDTWNDDAITRSRRQILRAGIFKSEPGADVSINPSYDRSRAGHADLRVDVTEDDTASINLNLGYSSSSGFQGSVGFTERNFDPLALLDGDGWRGAGHILSSNISWSRDRTSFGVTWTDPLFMDTPYFLSGGFNRIDSTAIDWDEVRQISNVTVGRYFFDYDLLLSIGYSYTDLRVKEVQLDASDQTWLQAPGSFHTNTITLRQTYDVLNNPGFPTEGFRISAFQSLNGGLLTASHEYYEVGLDADLYIPLAEAELGGVTFLKFRQKLGYMGTFDDDTTVPFYDRYYGGGPAPQHRGFESFELGPREQNWLGFISRPGGTSEWLTTVELNVPIQGTQRGLRAVLFSDIGYIWGLDRDPFDPNEYALYPRELLSTIALERSLGSSFRNSGMDLSDLKVAIGMGIRMPAFLPIALDFAWLVNPGPLDDKRQFHLNMSGGF